ncbi:MAG TPA: hypothetical protein DIW81_02230 [Planctomycetaceae bacterium]|nr:hypothetical protein [Planctomycetaceae bacterium]
MIFDLTDHLVLKLDDTVTTLPSQVYLTIEECSQRVSLSDSTIRRRIREGKIPFWQPGGPGTRILIPVDALLSSADCSPDAENSSKPSFRDRDKSSLPGPTAKWRRALSKYQS